MDAASSPRSPRRSGGQTPRRRRQRGRLGIDVDVAAAAAQQLPPLVGASPRRTPLAKQQEEERHALRNALQKRLQAHGALAGVSSLHEAMCGAFAGHAPMVSDKEADAAAEGEEAIDCFDAAKRMTRHMARQAPGLAQVLNEIVVSMQKLVQERLQHEASLAARMQPLESPRSLSHRPPILLEDGDERDRDDRNDGSNHSSNSDSSGGSASASESDSDADANSVVKRGQHDVSPPHRGHRLPRGPRFRTALRSRAFPPTRVPVHEHIHTTTSYMPVDTASATRNGFPLLSLHKQNQNQKHQQAFDDGSGAPQWTITMFPRDRPRLCADEMAAFAHWATVRLHASTDDSSSSSSTTPSSSSPASTLDSSLSVRELVCFELSRLVFDKCPTTARFLLGLFQELTRLTRTALTSADRDAQLVQQRQRNVQLELVRLQERRRRALGAVTALQATLEARHHRLLFVRALIIRRRRTLNQLLCADQVLLRRLVALIAHAHDLADDVLQHVTTTAAATPSPAVRALPLFHMADDATRVTAVDTLVQWLWKAYGELDEVAAVHAAHEKQQLEKAQTQQLIKVVSATTATSTTTDTGRTSAALPSPPLRPVTVVDSDVVVLDAASIEAARLEYRATLARLTRMLASASPDSSLGWDAQELWDQALFIPPAEEVRDLERDVQRLCELVEQRVLGQRFRRVRHHSVSCQTDISNCVVPGYSALTAVGQLAVKRSYSLDLGKSVSAVALTPSLMRRQSRRHTPVGPLAMSRPSLWVGGGGDGDAQRWRWRKHRRGRPPASASCSSTLTAVAPLSAAVLTDPAIASRCPRQRVEGLVPDGFRCFIPRVPDDYVAHPLALVDVHTIISYLFNSIWLLLVEDLHRQHPSMASASSSSSSSSSSFSSSSCGPLVIPLETMHDYVYRVYMQHFGVVGAAHRCLLDLLQSASRLDTQSGKVLLFCRLLGLRGVAALPADGFWFALRALHVLQRCCTNAGHYFLLDADATNESVSQAAATKALALLFHNSANDVHKRIRLKLAGLASVYGAVWIPVYNILGFVMDEWMSEQGLRRQTIESTLLLLGRGSSSSDHSHSHSHHTRIATLAEYLEGFTALQLHVNHTDAVYSYRCLLRSSRRGSDGTAATSIEPGPTADASWVPAPGQPSGSVDAALFTSLWVEQVLHVMNVAQQQTINPNAVDHGGMHLGAASDGLLAATATLAAKWLRISWTSMKPEVIHRLNAAFNDVGLQVRLVQQMEALHRDPKQPQTAGWASLRQLIQIAYEPHAAHAPGEAAALACVPNES